MGWSSGSQIAEDVWSVIEKQIPKAKRKKVAREIVNIFEANDCDTMDEAEDLMEAADFPRCDICGYTIGTEDTCCFNEEEENE
jgi:hypothetical protein